MEISEFFSCYADEESSKAFFKQKRAVAHTFCNRCGSLLVYWIEQESRWRCKECKHSMGLKQGTVMENSNLGYRVWLWGLFLMSLTKKGFSALEMQRLIGHKRYEPIWLMMQKIRISMGRRDDKYQLDGFLEMDEGFFEGHRKNDEDMPDGKPARELDRQVKAIVAISTEPIAEKDQREHRPKTKPGFIKMSVVSSLCSNEVITEAGNMIKKSATVMVDGRPCYNGLKNICKTVQKVIIKDKKKVATVFPWVHTAISNAKKKLLGLHHQVKDVYMQNYLDEFCYKFNRRHFGNALFDRLILTALEKPWYSS